MKELINDLIFKSGLNNKQFAQHVGTSESYLSRQKHFKHINHTKLILWAKMFDIDVIESKQIKIFP